MFIINNVLQNSVNKYKMFRTSTLGKALVPISIILTGKISILFCPKSWFTVHSNFSSSCKEPTIWVVDCILLSINSTGSWNANEKEVLFVKSAQNKVALNHIQPKQFTYSYVTQFSTANTLTVNTYSNVSCDGLQAAGCWTCIFSFIRFVNVSE